MPGKMRASRNVLRAFAPSRSMALPAVLALWAAAFVIGCPIPQVPAGAGPSVYVSGGVCQSDSVVGPGHFPCFLPTPEGARTASLREGSSPTGGDAGAVAVPSGYPRTNAGAVSAAGAGPPQAPSPEELSVSRT